MKKLKEIKNYLKIHLPYFFGAFFLFLLGIYLGYIKEFSFFKESLKEIEELASILKKLSPFGIFLLIFLNNLMANFFIIFLGLGMGIVPIFALILNGGIIGIFLKTGLYPFSFILKGTIPHGIIEIPILALAGGLGLKLGFKVMKKLFFKTVLKEDLSFAMSIFLKIILPGLFLSAFIEVFITPYILWGI